MANLLLDAAPRSVIVDGIEYAINWQYEYMVLVELTMFESGLDDGEKIARSLMLFFGDERMPPNIQAAQDALSDFYVGPKPKKQSAEAETKSAEALYSYEHDADLIFAAFLQQYGINLQHVDDLHWYEFRALLRGLTEDCLFTKILGYRSVDLSTFKDPKMKQYYRELKERYALPLPAAEQEKEDQIKAILRGDGDLSKIGL